MSENHAFLGRDTMLPSLRILLALVLTFGAVCAAPSPVKSQSTIAPQGFGAAIADATVAPAATTAASPPVQAAAASPQIHLGYGINVSAWDAQKQAWATELGLDWVKLYNLPGERLPFNVLLRLHGNWADYDDLDAYCAYVQGQAAAGLGKVEAYEIGNEPNLDWAWSEGAPGTELPNPAEYTAVLQKAHQCITAIDPTAIIVSGGLATVGPYDANADPPAYPNAWNDLKFLQAMYDHDARGYFDALGSHPYGFYFPPEQEPGGWADNPIYGNMYVDGLAFRRAEQQRAVMLANDDADTPIWATEWGWLLQEAGCRSAWEAQGRWWQVVDETTQADYIARAFDYAYDRWPWMGVMFLFNLDFSLSTWYDACDAVRYYAVRHTDSSARQAYNAVRDLPKRPYAVVSPQAVSLFLADEERGIYSRTVQVQSAGVEPLTYTVSADAPWLGVPGGVFTNSGHLTLTIDTTAFAIGATTAAITVTTNGGLSHVHKPVTVTVVVADEVWRIYLPLTLKAFESP